MRMFWIKGPETSCSRPTYEPACRPAAETRMATCEAAVGLKFPFGSGTVIQESSAFNCQANVVARDRLVKLMPALIAVPSLKLTFRERGLTITLGLNPTIEAR